MMEKTLSALIGKINIEEINGTLERQISGFCIDSRIWEPGQIYAAQPGIHSDGHSYIPDLIKKGCTAILHSTPLQDYAADVTYIRVSDTRKALSPLSAAFYDHPSTKLTVIGVTGTDGKSSAVSFTHQILEFLGYKAGFISTVEYKLGNIVEKNPYRMSTPESFEVQKLLYDMVQNGKEYVVLESTSHGLSKRYSRLSDVGYQVGVLTNITHEHLEFHGTIEQYADDKANLFRQLEERNGKLPTGILRSEEPFSSVFRDAGKDSTLLTYSSVDPQATAYASDIVESNIGLNFNLHYQKKVYPCSVPLAGIFNVQNVMASFLAVRSSTAAAAEQIVLAMAQLRGVKGRMESVYCGQSFKAIVDYAHSPGSFEKILPQIRSTTAGRLILLFGSAGERDTAKRSIQGRIASEYADVLVLSDEDPRGESSMDILKDIADGCSGKKLEENLFLIPDRTEGIRKALSLAAEGDTVMFLGKGHESSIIYKDGSIPWDEALTVKNVLHEIGYADD